MSSGVSRKSNYVWLEALVIKATVDPDIMPEHRCCSEP